MAEQWLTVAQAATMSKYHPVTLRKLIYAGRIKARKFGPVWQINRTSLMAYTHKASKLGAKRGPKRRS